jgi:hypothetical protein
VRGGGGGANPTARPRPSRPPTVLAENSLESRDGAPQGSSSGNIDEVEVKMPPHNSISFRRKVKSGKQRRPELLP